MMPEPGDPQFAQRRPGRVFFCTPHSRFGQRSACAGPDLGVGRSGWSTRPWRSGQKLTKAVVDDRQPLLALKVMAPRMYGTENRGLSFKSRLRYGRLESRVEVIHASSRGTVKNAPAIRSTFAMAHFFLHARPGTNIPHVDGNTDFSGEPLHEFNVGPNNLPLSSCRVAPQERWMSSAGRPAAIIWRSLPPLQFHPKRHKTWRQQIEGCGSRFSWHLQTNVLKAYQ